MKVKEIFAAIAALALSAGAALASTWDGGGDGTRWSDAANWDAGGVPGNGAVVILPDIGDPYVVTLDENATLSDLTVNADATLTIPDGNVLTLQDSDSNATHDIDGSIVLEGSASQLVFDGEDNSTPAVPFDHLLQGTGNVTGQNPGAAIVIDNPTSASADRKLTSRILLAGMMTMQPSASGSGKVVFENSRTSASEEGQVFANAAGAFTFDAGVILDDTANGSNRPLWKVGAASTSADVLIFNRDSDGSDADHPVLVGRFEVVQCGELRVSSSVTNAVITFGGLTLTSGMVTTNGAGFPYFISNWNGSTGAEIQNCSSTGSPCSSCP